MMNERQTEIVLFGNRFSIKSSLSDADIHALVQKVEQHIKNCQNQARSMSLQSAALMSCLSLAAELLEKNQSVDAFKENAVLRLSQLKELLDEAKIPQEKSSSLETDESPYTLSV